jgi:hypothetical protein
LIIQDRTQDCRRLCCPRTCLFCSTAVCAATERVCSRSASAGLQRVSSTLVCAVNGRVCVSAVHCPRWCLACSCLRFTWMYLFNSSLVCAKRCMGYSSLCCICIRVYKRLCCTWTVVSPNVVPKTIAGKASLCVISRSPAATSRT